MMEQLLNILSLLFLGISTSLAQTCPGELGWLKFQEKCYKFHAYPRQAKIGATNTCQNDGASLLSINSQSEHQFVDRWLQENDEARQQWLTSGVVRSDGVRWDGDGSISTTISTWRYPDGIRLTGSLVVLDYTGTEYLWNVGLAITELPFICEISVSEVYRISQEHRDFDYGLNVDNPSQAPRGPRFITEPENTVLLGPTTAFHMDCLASALPEPKYEWLKKSLSGEMVPIAVGANPRYTFTTGSLTIDKPVMQDAGMYQCMAMNEHGKILSQSVTVTFGDLGEFSNIPPAPVTGYEYKGAQLECPTITGSPAITYQWYKGGMQFIRPDFQKHTFISANGKLYFSSLAPSDEDTYYCMATLASHGDPGNYLGAFQAPSRISLGFKLEVAAGTAFDQPPDIQDEFIFVYPKTPMKGADVSLECLAYGVDPMTYTWSRDGKDLPKGHTLTSNNRILTLYDVSLEDDGTYTCRVLHKGYDDVKSTDLRILSKPYFTYHLTNQHVDVGSQLTWTCEASGRPVPTYTWYKNGEVLSSSPGITVNNNHLTIDRLSKEHNGMYQCGAINRYGTTFSSAQLRVLELVPSFEKSPMIKSISASWGGNVTIMCNPQAAPKPTYLWYKDNRALPLTIGTFQEEDHLKLLLNGNLMIMNVQPSDEGRYKCEVDNGIGKADDYSDLMTMESTVISLPPNDDKVEVNLSIALLCEASHAANIDMVYVWKFNNHYINFEREREYQMGTGSQEGSLYIIASQFKNEGTYTCVASTGMDTVSSSAYLTVMGPPGEPLGVKVKDSPHIIKEDVNDPDNTADRATTRWLMWTDGDNHFGIITHYTIEFHTSFDETWRVHPDGRSIPKEDTMDQDDLDKRYARVSNLKAGTMVSFRVRARNAYGLGAPSIPTPDTKIDDSAPTVVVQNVRGGGGSVGDLAIKWDPLPQEDHNGDNLEYVVGWTQFDGTIIQETAKWSYETVSHNKACQYVPDFQTGLIYVCKYVELVGADNYFKPYYVTVQAKNVKGDGPATEPQVIMSAEELPLAAPTNVKADQYNATALMVTWDPVPNNRQNVRGKLKGYKINYWRMNEDEEIDALQNIIELYKGTTNLEQGLIIGLEAFQWYEFNVQAYNSAGNGPKSSDYQQQTFNKVPKQYPTEVHVYSVEGYGVRVTFRGISTQWREEPLLGYIVQYWKARENIMSAGEVNFGKLTTGVIRNLTSSELYKLRVYGYSRGGQGARSSPAIYFTVGDGEILINKETMEMLNSSVYPTSSYMTIAILTMIAAAISNWRLS